MNSKKTFWQLIGENKIEIPVIQRDYAQGRKEDKVRSIRQEFVTDLLTAIESGEGKTMQLGFVYGKIKGKDKHLERERNKRAIENILNAVEGYAQQLDMSIKTEISTSLDAEKDRANLPTFIPLDGQQRLTTLYLLHWYLLVFAEGNAIHTKLENLQNFSYKTRKSSLEFCASICQQDNVASIKVAEDKLSEAIQNNKWFRKVWLKDSTVKGMLVMLDEIHEQIAEKSNKKELLNRLLDEKTAIISFDFFDLNELNQTDELYVKMNARGKQLSEFEHFKAWLQNYVSVEIPENSISGQYWEEKLDKEWLDLFWKNKAPGVFHIDNNIYHAFKQITLFEYIAVNGKAIEEEVTKVIRENTYIPFSYYKEHEFFTAKTLNFLFNSLNALSNKTRIQQLEEWLEDITCAGFFGSKINLSRYYLSNDKTVDRPESVFYYSFLLFLNHAQDKDSEATFKSWMCFTRNIIFNTYIQNPGNFIDAINSLNSLSEHIDSLDTYLTTPGLNIPFFGDAVRHEVAKLKLMYSEDSHWKEAIIEFENHPYFRGDIGFLLEMSKVGDEYDYQKFLSYGNCASLVFIDSIRKHSDKLLPRALLTFGNYLPRVGTNHLIPLSNGESLRARRDNWQRVFNNEPHRNILRDFFDAVKDNLVDLESKLTQLVKDYHQEDWRWYFVKSPDVIDFCTKGFIRFNNDHDILLLKTSRAYGHHAELRSYFAFTQAEIKDLESFEPFKNKEYWPNRMSQYSFSCIRFSGWEHDEQSYKLEITYQDDGQYLMQVLTDEKTEISDEITISLMAMDWQIKDENKILHRLFQNESDIKPLLVSTLKKLSEIS